MYPKKNEYMIIYKEIGNNNSTLYKFKLSSDDEKSVIEKFNHLLNAEIISINEVK